MRPRSARHEVQPMCGIAGGASTSGRAAPSMPAIVRRHVHAAGPSWSRRRRRLHRRRRRVWATGGWRSSTSRDAGRQPMSSADGRFWITFNGEIYNFLELREAVRSRRATGSVRTPIPKSSWRPTPRTASACLEHLRGMFAFAIWDAQRAVPLHRARSAGQEAALLPARRDGIAFASEPKAFLAEPGFEATAEPAPRSRST